MDIGKVFLKALILFVSFFALLNWGTPFLVNDVGTPGLIVLPFAWFGYACVCAKAFGFSIWKKDIVKNEENAS